MSGLYILNKISSCKFLNAGNLFLGYAVESITRSLQVQIVDALCSGERRKASSLLLDLGNRNQSIKADDFVYILKHCARSPDPLVSCSIWNLSLAT